MSLTTEQIKNVLGSSNSKKKVLSNEMKERIVEMVGEGSKLVSIVEELRLENDKVKTGHVKSYLQRYLKRLLKEQE